MNTYCIKKGYIANPPLTLNSEDIEEYWTEQRVSASASFQYHIYEKAKDLFKEHKFQSLMDLGSGPGLKSKMFFSNLTNDILLVDQRTTETIARKVFPEAKFYGHNLEEMLHLKKKYDMIICADVIEHLEDPDFLIESIKANLANNGLAVISTPERDVRRGKSNMQSPNKQHVREWNKHELSTYLEFKGFDVVKINLMPMKKLPKWKMNLIYFFKPIFKNCKPEWFSNQMVVLKVKK